MRNTRPVLAGVGDKGLRLSLLEFRDLAASMEGIADKKKRYVYIVRFTCYLIKKKTYFQNMKMSG